RIRAVSFSRIGSGHDKKECFGPLHAGIAGLARSKLCAIQFRGGYLRYPYLQLFGRLLKGLTCKSARGANAAKLRFGFDRLQFANQSVRKNRISLRERPFERT